MRKIVEAAAADYAAWVKLVGVVWTVVRKAPHLRRSDDAANAHKLAAAFSGHRLRLASLRPPARCQSLHESCLAWLGSLHELAIAVPPAIESSRAEELERVVRATRETQLRLRDVRRVYTGTVGHVRRLYQARPSMPTRPSRPPPRSVLTTPRARSTLTGG